MFYVRFKIEGDTIIIYDKKDNEVGRDSIEGLLLEMGWIKED